MVYDIRPMPLLKQYQAWDAINISPDNPFMTMRAYLQSCISLQCEEETTLLLLSYLGIGALSLESAVLKYTFQYTVYQGVIIALALLWYNKCVQCLQHNSIVFVL